MTTQHICPFCGDVMYETGGRMNILGWVAIIPIGGILVAGLSSELEKSGSLGKAFGIVGSFLFWGYILYRIFRKKKY